METIQDIPYANTTERNLLLDLYLPDNVENPYLVIWLHGGIWRFGSKDEPRILGLVEEGFAVASIDFRNSPEAQFPAQIHDIKAAIRYLRGTATEYGYRNDKIAIWGYSSGGHLASLTGTTNGNVELEGTLGNYLNVSSDIQAIVVYSGPSNLHTILNQSTPHGIDVRAPGMADLLGKPVEDPAIQTMVTLASPALQVSAAAPPILLMHGVQDNQVPINQAIELELAYRKVDRPVETEWILEAEHTSGEYFSSPYIEQVAAFLNKHFQTL